MKKLLGVLAMGVLVLLGGCGTVTVKHEVQPIYITVDVNIKVQKELEDFFDFEDEEAEKKKKENL
ncbi:MAG: hypothetical protein V3U73_12120 [bacterium]